MKHWALDSVFYHIYPPGLCGAPRRNDFNSPVVPRLEQLYGWINHLQNLGVNAVWLGPVFESSVHGYDTADYFQVDRRLGSNQTLKEVIAALHQNGIRVVLDAVFNHVGRDFWAFRDVRQNNERSAYCDWFQGLNFEKRSPFDDPFTYTSWDGHYDLVKLNLLNPAVKAHLFQAVKMWLHEFSPDGFRLDAADCIDMSFLQELGSLCRSIRPDFWLMGEVVHGNYRKWANSETLDSVTNYECYKGLYSSHVDRNYFEIAYALNRQFGDGGLYCDVPLYNFADNHDVNRVAGNLTNPAHLYTLYCLLFTMPGVPSIYYGSEWGLEAKRTNGDDRALRPHLDLATLSQTSPHPDLVRVIARLAKIRRSSQALTYGNYRQLSIRHEQFAFARQTADEHVVVLVNASEKPARFKLDIPACRGTRLIDLLNPGEAFPVSNGHATVNAVWPCWARIMVVK
ncbi:MAG: alpha-glucosidase C-terminal domain-containing protein [Desulfomonile tiedjei]|nr:alpha-glucosidase C-terminal domain-containing protein [Desulfomonile tiedjei]